MPAAMPTDAELAWHRVAITGPDASEVAVLLGLPADGDQAVVVAGPERATGRVRRIGASIRVEFPSYLTALTLHPGAGGAHHGHYEVASPAWGAGTLRLHTAAVAGPTLAAQATLRSGPPLALGGPTTFWRLRLGELTVKLRLDERQPGEVEGTMFFDNGHVSYLGGSARADRVLLAGFAGDSPFSLDVQVSPDRMQLDGTWRAGHLLGWRAAIAGTRVADDFAVVPKVAVDAPSAVLHHALLRDHANQPLIVELAATWCSTCRNVAPVLQALHTQYAPQGLGMVTLLYELTTDATANRAAEQRFREVHGTTWPIHAVPGEQEDLFDTLPEGVSNVDIGGFPVVIFRRRDGTIAGVHAGFPGSSTGAAHQAAVARFRELTAEVMRSAPQR